MSGNYDFCEKKGDVCPVCGRAGTEALKFPVASYRRCEACGSVYLEPEYFLSPEEERSRYLKHENSLEDSGYRKYLEAFLDGILEHEAVEADSISQVFDYGSGPEPALVMLLRQRGFTAEGWDPYFNTAGQGFEGGADLVTCLEVAEHFHEPRNDFQSLAVTARPNGLVAVATHPVSSDRVQVERDFPAWWYRQDPTHVVFYTREGLILAAEQAGLLYLGQCGSCTFLFRREAVEQG